MGERKKLKKCNGEKDGNDFSYKEAEKWIINYLNNLCKKILHLKKLWRKYWISKFLQSYYKSSHIIDGYKELKRPEKEIIYYSEIPIFIKTIDGVTLKFEVKIIFTVKKFKKKNVSRKYKNWL